MSFPANNVQYACDYTNDRQLSVPVLLAVVLIDLMNWLTSSSRQFISLLKVISLTDGDRKFAVLRTFFICLTRTLMCEIFEQNFLYV